MGKDSGIFFEIELFTDKLQENAAACPFLRNYVDFGALRRFNTVCLFDFTLN